MPVDNKAMKEKMLNKVHQAFKAHPSYAGKPCVNGVKRFFPDLWDQNPDNMREDLKGRENNNLVNEMVKYLKKHTQWTAAAVKK